MPTNTEATLSLTAMRSAATPKKDADVDVRARGPAANQVEQSLERQATFSGILDSPPTVLRQRELVRAVGNIANVATSLRMDVETAVKPPRGLRAGDNPGTSNLSSTDSGYAAEHAGHTFRSMPQEAHILRCVENARSGTTYGT